MEVEPTELLQFLDQSPSPWHSAEQISEELAGSGFARLEEDLPWVLKRGGRYFIARGAAIAAFITPEKVPTEFRILISHLDSPALKLKPNPDLTAHGLTLLGLEPYGSGLLNTWLNRDMGLAGRIWVEQRQGFESYLIKSTTGLFIAQMAPHFRALSEPGEGQFNHQDHLVAIAGLADLPGESFDLARLLQQEVRFERLLSHDLTLFPLEPARLLGSCGEFLSGPRLDNLVSAHACLGALLGAAGEEHALKIAFFFNHEEIGSRSEEGADSSLAHEIFERICIGLQIAEEEKFIALRNSRALSVDMAHAVGPGHKERFEPNHAPLLGNGVVLKHNVSRRYASDPLGTAEVAQIAKSCNISLQNFTVRSDATCGSTVGPHFAAASGIKTIDLGIAQLSMHASREQIATGDYLALRLLLQTFLASPLSRL